VLQSARAAEAPSATGVIAAAPAPLSPDDVSWLFPVPRNAKDLVNFIAISDLTAPDPNDSSKREPIWPAAAFAQFIANANGPATQISPSHHLKLPPEALDIKAWHLAGLRIDPGAPGLTPEIIAQYGQQPQVRLILQPITRLPNGGLKVHDVAAHIIYTFITGFEAAAEPGCFPRPKPDLTAFNKIVGDFSALRDELQSGKFGKVGIKTAGRLLGVHPGLANRAAAKPLRDALSAVLQKHLSGDKISGMAVMGLADSGPEPWIFLAMTAVGPGATPALPNGGFIPVPGPTLDGSQFAQGLAVLETPHQVIPTPATNNLNPITCKNAASQAGAAALPVAERKGLATAELFDLGDRKLVKPADISKVKEIADLIGDTSRSHFFNTDCISCHTDTRRTMDLLKVTRIAGVDPAVLPKEKWNVRNFGWFPSILRKTLEPTATRRVASETNAVIEFINKNGLAKP
jgi:hypothetical protein